MKPKPTPEPTRRPGQNPYGPAYDYLYEFPALKKKRHFVVSLIKWLGIASIALLVIGIIAGAMSDDPDPSTASHNSITQPKPSSTKTAAAKPTQTPSPKPTQTPEPTTVPTITPNPTSAVSTKTRQDVSDNQHSSSAASTQSLPLGVPRRAEWATVTGHVDGDTVKISLHRTGQTVLMAGIDAPEKGECYASESSARVKKLLPKGTKVWLETSGTDRDGSDRLLRYVWLEGKDGKKATLINTKMVREGYAGFDGHHDNPKYYERLEELQQDARKREVGVWGTCGELHALLPTPTPTASVPGLPSNTEQVTVTDIVDGDTIRVRRSNGSTATVRLILIDTPETVDPSSPVECFGAEASSYTSLVMPISSTVYLEKDVSETDRYDRLLRYAWYVDPGSGQAILFDEQMVRDGYAALATFPPDLKYVDRIRAAQDAAIAVGAGLWAACGGVDTPLLPPTPTPVPAPAQSPVDTLPTGGCDASYPGVCIPPAPPDLNCGDVPYRGFAVVPPDPHRFDGDHDGIGCES